MSKSADARPVIPRVAGLLTQLCGAGCVLVGTVAFALLIDQMDGAYLAILLSWIGAGMVALVCGGLAGRPSPAALVLGAALNASFAGVLFAVASRLPLWLRLLSAEDAANASTAVITIGVASGVSMLACLVATPLALRYWRVSEPRGSRELPAVHFGPGGPGAPMGAGGPYFHGGPGGPSVGAMPQGGPMGGYGAPGMTGGPGAPGMRGPQSPVGGQELEPSSTAPGFPPPVTGAFQLSPADSGEIVMLPGGGKPPPSAHPLRPAVAQQPRTMHSALPQQPAPAVAQSASPYAASASPYAASASPYAASASPYAAPAAPSPYAAPAAPSPYAPPAMPTPSAAANLFRAESTSSPYAPALRSDSAAPYTAAPRPDSVPSSFSPMISPPIEPQPPLRRERGPAFGRPDSSFGPPHDDHTPPPYYTGYPAPAAARGPDHTPPPGSFAYAPPHRDHTPPPPYQLAGVPDAVPAHFDRTPAPLLAPGFGDPAFVQRGGPLPLGPNGAPGPGPGQPGYGPGPGQPGYGPGPGQPAPFPPAPMLPPGYAPSFGGQPGFLADPTPPLHHAPPGLAPAAPSRSRRLLWIAAAGLVIGGLTGVILLASDGEGGGAPVAQGGPRPGDKPAPPQDQGGAVATPVTLPAPDAGGAEASALTALPAPRSPRELLDAVHQVVGRVDAAALKTLLVPAAFGFGVRATSINRGVDAVVAALAADLGAAPATGFTVTPLGTEIGEEGDHAWIAEELELTGAGTARRRFAVTMLAAAIEGRWRVVAWHWAVRLPDEEIERLVEAGDLHIPEGFDDKLEAPDDIVEAFRAAFSSTESYSLAVSPRGSAFNFGSAPGERLRGGDTIRRVFKKLRAEIRLSDGVMVTAANVWDPTIAAPTVAWAAANVEFVTRKSRRILRVLSILVRENDEWRLVQTQWSDGA